MNISRLYILPEGSDEARIYEWDHNHLTMEELVAFMAMIKKIPDMKRWIKKDTPGSIQDAI